MISFLHKFYAIFQVEIKASDWVWAIIDSGNAGHTAARFNELDYYRID